MDMLTFLVCKTVFYLFITRRGRMVVVVVGVIAELGKQTKQT